MTATFPAGAAKIWGHLSTSTNATLPMPQRRVADSGFVLQKVRIYSFDRAREETRREAGDESLLGKRRTMWPDCEEVKSLNNARRVC